MATSSSDGTACIWDLRSISVHQPKTLKKVSHKRVVQSAHFSHSGSSPTTTSRDNTVGMVTGVNFDHTSMIKHDDQSGDSMSYFSLAWVVNLFLGANQQVNACLGVVEISLTIIHQLTTGGLDLIASQVSAQLKILEFATIQPILKNTSLPGLPDAL
ncbi:hypothetical protein CMV_025827 [Castanea mollissima]|uniref:Uncharacterized protein n=1 Tax=Castanea mollissima TaxID=60419 RepID=A0A8J4QCR6_9ROSI|nr:hypothetical protein CMV_025827 [Castanea mollissima]